MRGGERKGRCLCEKTLALCLYTISDTGLKWATCWATIFRDGPYSAPALVNRFTKAVVIR